MSAALPALVTDAQMRSVVAGIRGLGRGGVEVLAVAPRLPAAGRHSRYAKRSLSAPWVRTDARAFAQRVHELAAAHAPVVVYPGIEDSLQALREYAPALPDGAVFPYPPLEMLDALRDKRTLRALSAAAGFAEIATYGQGRKGELDIAGIPVPCVVKSAAPVGTIPFPYVASTREELHAVFLRLDEQEEVLIQERAPGPLMAVSLVLDRDGRVVARFQQEARRSWPAAAGPSSLALSVAPDEALVERTAAMLADAGFWGMAEVQMMGTVRGPAPIDVNPRYYGSLPLALASGVNLPAAWHAVVAGERLPAPGPYRTGVLYRWLEADLSAALQGHPRRLLTPRSRPRVGAMWARDDPLPALLLAADTVTGRITRWAGR